jgi:hypothetical protein
LAGIVSITATILSALQTYLNFAEQAEKHREAGARYAEIRRQFDLIDIEFSRGGSDIREQAVARLKEIVNRLDEIGNKSPSIPDRIYDAARRSANAAAYPGDVAFLTEASPEGRGGTAN